MAIKKVIDGKLVTIADKSITDHSQLTGTQAYGCHPISAIRKLPEKLHELKSTDERLAEELDSKIATATRLTLLVQEKANQLNDTLIEANRVIQEIKNDINRINLSVDGSTVTFIDVNNNSQSFRVGSDVDNDTIKTDANGRITLKKVYTNEEFTGDGTELNSLQLKTKPDNSSIVINNNKYEARAIKDSNGNSFTYQDIANQNTANQNAFTAVQTQFETTAQSVSNNFNQVNNSITQLQAVDNSQAQKISDLQARTKGLGGYLNAYNFGANPSQNDLTNYAIQDTQVQNAIEIFNGTKVKNLHDGHVWVLTNTPDSDPVVFSWQDLGVDPAVADANNDGVHGLITGSYEHLEAFVDLLGHLTINGLQEELNSISTSISALANRVSAVETALTRKADVDSNGNLIINGNSITIDNATITYNSTTQTWEI